MTKPIDLDAIEELYRDNSVRGELAVAPDDDLQVLDVCRFESTKIHVEMFPYKGDARFYVEIFRAWPALRDELRELRGEIKSYNGLREVYKMLASENESLRTKLTQVEAERDRLLGEVREKHERMFPIMGGRAVPWGWIAPYDSQAVENHNQSLDQLARRGGLAPGEALCVVLGLRWRDAPERYRRGDTTGSVALEWEQWCRDRDTSALRADNEKLRAEVERLKDALKTATQSAINGWAVGDGERSSPMMQVVRANAAELLPDWSPDD